MYSDPVISGGPTAPRGVQPPQDVGAESGIRSVFLGPNGIRAGWRLLIFAVIVGILLTVVGYIQFVLARGQRASITPQRAILGEGGYFLAVLIASWIMGRIEKRKIADYGLPIRKASGNEFCQGAVFGFIAMTLLLGALHVAGVFKFGSRAIYGVQLAKYAILWGIAFLCVGFFEEYAFRGYPQFTLTMGMGFWPAAVLLSAGFGALHLLNGGEDWVGALSVFGSGLTLCLLLRRSGSLWMPIGFHMAWDWAETFFYGVPDSGVVAPGHMFNPTFHGSKWLTGGSVGPEGSVFVFMILGLCWIFFHFWLPKVKYPNLDA